MADTIEEMQRKIEAMMPTPQEVIDRIDQEQTVKRNMILKDLENSGLAPVLLRRVAEGDQEAFGKVMNIVMERVNMMPPQMPKIADEDLPKYNGGLTTMDAGGGWKFPLPVPDEGKKWAVRLYDTKSGEILPELVQVPKDEPVSKWKEGYPKYD